ncbi:hypothetical protein BJV78DRAFT_173978 [Lactifluus subvellereus]|nr:hypothetical protein BJV78DRAFT_173978 [Lactifluus subvellereus]
MNCCVSPIASSLIGANTSTATASASHPPPLILPRPGRPTCQLTCPERRLSLVTSPLLRAHILATLHNAPAILGSGGSGLLMYNHAHAVLERGGSCGHSVPCCAALQLGFCRQGA